MAPKISIEDLERVQTEDERWLEIEDAQPNDKGPAGGGALPWPAEPLSLSLSLAAAARPGLRGVG